jgi:hypothetical protein
MNALLDAICAAGLNRARIHDALADMDHYDGVTGRMVFDPNLKNVAPLYLGTVHNGAITYRVATMDKPPAVQQTELTPQGVPAVAQKPYAIVGEDGVQYAGPHGSDAPAGPIAVILFGPDAAQIASSPGVVAELASVATQGRPWKLLPIASNQNWGAASTALVHALMDDHALAILALDRDASHLAEQLALKSFVPVVALSADTALTSANIPWIFRLPQETAPAAALQMLFAAEQRSGANAERLRDVLASGDQLAGVAFLPGGEPRLP